ncbi:MULTISPECIES: hypothetical protein [Desertifilum]|uniref:Uncharacterized protein n=2 Tax=Desertifilum tharense IPPAS B-1220 TaxID=1781255 RepID=A0ACD5GWR8_9CYAN|nr:MULTISPECIES: hypothetical protein [Desertifilum]MDA0213642.1 hypothetical protein [Cyanobacteria bacterium FC1]
MMTPIEMNRLGYQALFDALGFDGMVRFLSQFNTGQGNYTEERYQWLNNLRLEDVFSEIEEVQQQNPNATHY